MKMLAVHNTVIVRSRMRAGVTVFVVTALAVALLADPSSAQADEKATPVIGSFAVGGSVTAGIDERVGTLSARLPLAALAGVSGDSVELGISYSHERAAAGGDPYGLGSGWGWNVSRVYVDGDVKVVTPSGQTFSASATDSGDGNDADNGTHHHGDDDDGSENGDNIRRTTASGLEGYSLGDLLFSQDPGALPPGTGTSKGVTYAYSLEYAGGVKDFFSEAGNLVARIGPFGQRVEWDWGDNDRLMGITDDSGASVTIRWTDAGTEIVSPPRSDGVVTKTVIERTENRLSAVSDAIGDTVKFSYDDAGLLAHVFAASGAVTDISYQPLPNNHVGNNATVVDRVDVWDVDTGAQLSSRSWRVLGTHNPHGSPQYTSAAEMWASGDGEYRYQTVVTDGVTSVKSEYNSMGLMLSRELIVSTSHGEVTAQQQSFEYPGTAGGSVPERNSVPEQYARPTVTNVTHRDDHGRTRSVTERAEYDTVGRVTRQIRADNAVTETVYDDVIPAGAQLPVGLVLAQTTTGFDGTTATTSNELTPDHTSVQATETRVGTASATGATKTSRTEYTIQSDGFVSEEKLIAAETVAGGPDTVTTRYARVVDTAAKTVTLTQTDAAGTDAQSTNTTVRDLVTGLALSTRDPVGRVATTTYDAAGRVLSETSAAGIRTVTEYDNTTTRVTDAHGVTISEHVDVLGQIIKITDNITVMDDGTIGTRAGVERVIETRDYHQNNSKVTVTDARGRKTSTTSDIFGRPVLAVGPSGLQEVTEYDDVANTIRSGIVPPSGSGLADALQVTTRRMDDADRVVESTTVRHDARTVPNQTKRYDGLGRVVSHGAGDVQTNSVFNADGTPKTTTVTPMNPVFPGDPVTAEREHELRGISTKKVLTRENGEHNEKGEIREGVARVLDAAGRTAVKTDQNGQRTSYAYTPDGLVSETRADATAVVKRNTYHPMTRALTLSETIAADGTASRVQFDNDPITGDVVSVCDPSACEATRIAYTYNIYGNVTQTLYPDGTHVRHTFDEFGRQTESADILGNTTRYDYDELGLLDSVTQTNPEGTELGHVTYGHDEYGRVDELSRDNGLITHYTFTDANEIKTETTRRHNEPLSEPLNDSAYEYDSHGNLVQRIETRTEVDTSQRTTQTTRHTYNAYNQLIETTVRPGNPQNITENGSPSSKRNENPSSQTVYEIGVSGNVTQETTTHAHTTQKREFEHNSLGQTTAITTTIDNQTPNRVEQTYDGAGNLIDAADGTKYTYNLHNQPVTETRPGTTVTHSYWATGQRNSITTQHNANGDATSTSDSTTSRPRTHTVNLYWDGTTLVNDAHTSVNDAHTSTGSGTSGDSDTRETDNTVADVSITNTNIANNAVADTSAATDSLSVGSYLIGISRHVRTLAILPSSDTIPAAPTTVDQTHYVTDRHGNITALTDTNGKMVTAYTYTDYGFTTERTAAERTGATDTATEHIATERETTDAQRNPFQYAAEYTTPAGIQLLGNRGYDPSALAFTTKDTADQFNLYAYANANPITFVDPTGQTPERDIAFAFTMAFVVIGLFFAPIAIAQAAVAISTASALQALGIASAVKTLTLAFTSTAIDLTATGIAAAQMVNDHFDGADFFEDDTSDFLSKVGLGLAILGGVFAVGALYNHAGSKLVFKWKSGHNTPGARKAIVSETQSAGSDGLRSSAGSVGTSTTSPTTTSTTSPNGRVQMAQNYVSDSPAFRRGRALAYADLRAYVENEVSKTPKGRLSDGALNMIPDRARRVLKHELGDLRSISTSAEGDFQNGRMIPRTSDTMHGTHDELMDVAEGYRDYLEKINRDTISRIEDAVAW